MLSLLLLSLLSLCLTPKNPVHGHRTGSNNSGADEYPTGTRKIVWCCSMSPSITEYTPSHSTADANYPCLPGTASCFRRILETRHKCRPAHIHSPDYSSVHSPAQLHRYVVHGQQLLQQSSNRFGAVHGRGGYIWVGRITDPHVRV